MCGVGVCGIGVDCIFDRNSIAVYVLIAVFLLPSLWAHIAELGSYSAKFFLVVVIHFHIRIAK